jgi:hypothetical protein
MQQMTEVTATTISIAEANLAQAWQVCNDEEHNHVTLVEF